MGAMTPLGKVATRRLSWLANVAIFTASGAAASVAVGAALGWLGSALLPAVPAVGLALAVALLAAARELRWPSLPLPEVRRQTNGAWAGRSARTAALLWGFDLGLVFTTWLTFSGVWLLVVLSVGAGSPAFGAALFTAYWLGRSLSVWLGPLLVANACAMPELVWAIGRQGRALRLTHGAALLWAGAILTWMLLAGAAL